MDMYPFLAANVPDFIYKNYYTSDGFAYTKDHIIVTKLLVSKIPPNTKIDEIREYFSRFGYLKPFSYVRNVDFLDAHLYPYVAYVQFKSPRAAARVLNYYHNARLGRTNAKYFVKVCGSLHQPNCQYTNKMLQDWSVRFNESGVEDQFVPPNRDSILVLNDDCLEQIIRFLPISSQLFFARSCSRICQVYQMTCKSLHRSLFLDRLAKLSQWQLLDFFDFAGDDIIRIVGNLTDSYEHAIAKSASHSFRNVETLDLVSLSIRVNGHAPFLNFLTKLKKLKTLHLSGFQIQGKELHSLPSAIESLTVNFCRHVEDNHLISLCQSLTNLKVLDLSRSLYISETAANTMAVTCPNLEDLTFSCMQSDYGLIAKLSKLKKLTVTLPSRFSPALIAQLVEHKSHLMQYLHVTSKNCVNDNIAEQISRLKLLRTLACPDNCKLTEIGLQYLSELEHLEEIDLRSCDQVKSAALLNLILKCNKLKRVHIQGCYNITNQFIIDLIKKMQEQMINKTFTRKKPILFMAKSTYIVKDILNAPEYKTFSYLIIDDKKDDAYYFKKHQRGCGPYTTYWTDQ